MNTLANSGYPDNISCTSSNTCIERRMFSDENLPSRRSTAVDFVTQLKAEHSATQRFIECHAFKELNQAVAYKVSIYRNLFRVCVWACIGKVYRNVNILYNQETCHQNPKECNKETT